MKTYSKRVARLEASAGLHEPVQAVWLMDTDEMIVLSMRSAAEHERMPRAVFEARYPEGAIVKAYGEASMWDAV